jgi:hypothetical protein
MIPCPDRDCQSQNTRVLRERPSQRARVVGRVVIRHHRCLECQVEFRSYQLTVTDELSADAILDLMVVA